MLARGSKQSFHVNAQLKCPWSRQVFNGPSADASDSFTAPVHVAPCLQPGAHVDPAAFTA